MIARALLAWALFSGAILALWTFSLVAHVAVGPAGFFVAWCLILAIIWR
jgi:hypothetical protein